MRGRLAGVARSVVVGPSGAPVANAAPQTFDSDRAEGVRLRSQHGQASGGGRRCRPSRAGALDLIRRPPHHPGMDRRRFLVTSVAGAR
jgi:hypothetical protein